MALQSSGSISLGNIRNEFNDTGSVSISEFYGPPIKVSTTIPASGQISFSNFYSATNTFTTSQSVSINTTVGTSASASRTTNYTTFFNTNFTTTIQTFILVRTDPDTQNVEPVFFNTLATVTRQTEAPASRSTNYTTFFDTSFSVSYTTSITTNWR